MEFSKKVFIAIFVVWIVSIIATGTVKVLFNVDLDSIMAYVHGIFAVEVTAYSAKAAIENYSKINNNEQ